MRDSKRVIDPFHTKLGLSALSLCILLSSLSTSIANIALPQLASHFGTNMQAVQWVLLAYLLAITTLIVSVGRMGDVVGRRRLLLLGLAVFAVASCLCALATRLPYLIAARAVQGVGAAIMMALGMALAAETVGKPKLGRAMGLLGSMSALGTALGPTLGGLLLAHLGWQALFYGMLPFIIAAAWLAYRYLPKEFASPAQHNSPFDWLGTVLLAGTLAAYAVAMTGTHNGGAWKNIGLLLIAIVGLVLFLIVESQLVAPLMPIKLLRHRDLGSSFVMSALVTTVVMASLVVGPFYLSTAFDLGPAQVGLVMSTGPIVAALTGLPAGRLVGHWGASTMVKVGLVSMGVGSAFLPILADLFAVTGYIASLLLITAGYALFQAANNTAVMQVRALGQSGLLAGLLNLARNLGLITGASLMGRVFAMGSMYAQQGSAMATGLQWTFTLAAILIAIAFLIAYCSQKAATASK